MSSTRRRPRSVEVLRGSWGLALLLAPRIVLRSVHRADADPTSVLVARILGGRQLAQATLSGLDPTPSVLALGVWVDSVHATTALALALADPARARAGYTDAAVATAWGALGWRDLRRSQPSTSGDGTTPGVRDRLATWALGLLPGGQRLRRLGSPPPRRSGS